MCAVCRSVITFWMLLLHDGFVSNTGNCHDYLGCYFSCGAAAPLAGTWIWASPLWTSPGSTAAGWRAGRSQGGSLRPRDCSRRRRWGENGREGGEGMTRRQEKMQLVNQGRGMCRSQVFALNSLLFTPHYLSTQMCWWRDVLRSIFSFSSELDHADVMSPAFHQIKTSCCFF